MSAKFGYGLVRDKDGTALLQPVSAAGASERVVTIGGVVEYRWAEGDTDTSGPYEAEFEVTYADGTVETFPSDGYISVEVTEAIA